MTINLDQLGRETIQQRTTGQHGTTTSTTQQQTKDIPLGPATTILIRVSKRF